MGFGDVLLKVVGFLVEAGADSYERTARNARVEARRTGNQANLDRANEALLEIEGKRQNWKAYEKATQSKLKAREQQKNMDNENEE